MKHIRHWIQRCKLHGILMLLLLAACSESGEDLEEPLPPESEPELVRQEITLKSGTDRQPVVGQSGGSLSIEFTATAAWTATVSDSQADSWIDVSPVAGEAGEAVVTVTIAPNEGTDERSASVFIDCGEDREVIVVAQKQKEEESALSLSAKALYVGSEGGTVDVQVQSNVAYTFYAEAEYDWISELPSKTLSAHTIYFKVQPNDTYDVREARFIFTDETGTFTETLLVRQSAAKGLTVNTYFVSLAAEDRGFSLAVQTNVEYTVSIDGDWLRLVGSRGLTTETLAFVCEQNVSPDFREATIQIDSEIGIHMIQVVQGGKTEEVSDFMNVSPAVLSFGWKSDIFTVTVSTNVMYSVISNAAWISSTVTGLTDNTFITFTLAENEGTSNREAILTFASEDGSIVRTVTVTQGGKRQFATAGGQIEDFTENEEEW